MIQLFADEQLVYDSRLEYPYSLLTLSVTVGIQTGGTASFTMLPNNPAYNSFTSYRTIVTIYRDGILLFRGRALYPTDDFYNRRTITCEGERCFFLDGVHRAYLYQDSPEAIFAQVIGVYNDQVEPFKQFKVGEVTVTDPNEYIRLESETAVQVSEVIDKLVERCGGYLVFTTDATGQRVINWYAELTRRSGQEIEFGENLLDFARSSSNAELATVIVPYGAMDETTGQRVDITSVNDGRDYIQDDDAVALRGVIARPVYWDDVTLPQNLLTKAQHYLATSRLMVTSLTVPALDLSDMDKNIDTFQVGDTVRVRSKPHGVDDDFQLTERTYDLLNPANGRVTLGKNTATLTGADAAGDRQNASNLHRVGQAARTQYEAIRKYIRFDGAKILLGDVGSELVLQTQGGRIRFMGDVVNEGEPSAAFVLMDLKTDGTGLAFGKVAEKPGAVEIGLRAYDQYGTHLSNGMSLYGGSGDHIDANTTVEHLVLTALNTPDDNLWYVETIFRSSKLETSDRRQVAMPYRRGGPTYSRYYTDGVWSAWESSMLDAWPVGSIYLAFNHIDPSTLFGGSWTRISGTFLWAAQEGDTIGQTGDVVGYDSAEDGGQVDGNALPYIQVSVWKRTS